MPSHFSSTSSVCSPKLGAGLDALELRIADEIGPPDRLEQRVPMRGIGTTGINVAVVVGPAGLARVDPARHVDARQDLGAVALGRRAGRRLRGERDADV